MKCRACGSKGAREALRRGVFEHLLVLLLISPLRCLNCGHRRFGLIHFRSHYARMRRYYLIANTRQTIAVGFLVAFLLGFAFSLGYDAGLSGPNPLAAFANIMSGWRLLVD